MAECECLGGCPFFNDKMANMPATAGMYKRKYCHEDKDSCARYQVRQSLGAEKVPADLFPNQSERIAGIIAAG